jgi:hypothetical protein
MSVPSVIQDVIAVINQKLELSPKKDKVISISLWSFVDYKGDTIPKGDLWKVLRRLEEDGVIKLSFADHFNHLWRKAEDRVEFEIDRRKLEDFIKKNAPEIDTTTKAVGGKLKFIDKEAALIMGDKKCSLPPFKNEHFLCRAMFKHAKGKPVDWSEVYETITGYYQESYGKPPKTKENYHRVYDPVQQINQRVKKDLGTEKLFDWREMTITRLL